MSTTEVKKESPDHHRRIWIKSRGPYYYLQTWPDVALALWQEMFGKPKENPCPKTK
jgi:hypothetical protein